MNEKDKGVKFNSGKYMMHLVPLEALKEVAKVFTYGAKKYTADNWRKGMSFSRYFNAAERHLQAFWLNENIDEESGLPHLAHAICNLMMLYVYSSVSRYIEFDDRLKEEKNVKNKSIHEENHDILKREVALWNSGDIRRSFLKEDSDFWNN